MKLHKCFMACIVVAGCVAQPADAMQTPKKIPLCKKFIYIVGGAAATVAGVGYWLYNHYITPSNPDLRAKKVSKKIKKAINIADFDTIEQLITSGQESATNVVFSGKTPYFLLQIAIWRYHEWKYNPSWYECRAKDTPGIAERGLSAIITDAKKVIIFLIDQGAPLDVVSGDNMTSLQLTIRHHLSMPEIAEILLRHGASTTIKYKDGIENKDGLTPLQYAVRENAAYKDFDEIVALLLSYHEYDPAREKIAQQLCIVAKRQLSGIKLKTDLAIFSFA